MLYPQVQIQSLHHTFLQKLYFRLIHQLLDCKQYSRRTIMDSIKQENLREKIEKYWGEEDEKLSELILKDMLEYANSNPDNFTKQFIAIQFEEELDAISVVFEALTKDTDNWEQLYTDTMDRIFAAA